MTTYPVPDTLASPEDYRSRFGAPDTSDDVLTATLEACTDLVYRATMTAVYRTDPTTGLASDPVIAAALSDATCIQAAAWITLSISPYAGGITQAKAVSSKKIGSAAFEYAGAAATAAATADAATTLVPAAVRRLQRQGLISSRARVL
jgi:hypothetical protein